MGKCVLKRVLEYQSSLVRIYNGSIKMEKMGRVSRHRFRSMSAAREHEKCENKWRP